MGVPVKERGLLFDRAANASGLPSRRPVLPGREVLDQFNSAKEAAIGSVLPSAMSVLISRPDYNPRTREAEHRVVAGGAGFVVESNSEEILVMTNKHVVNDLQKYPHLSLSVQSSYRNPDGTTRKGTDYDDAEVVYMSPDFDVAIIAIKGNDSNVLPAAKLGTAEGLRAGQTVITVGAPYLITDTIAVGTVSHEGQVVMPSRFGKNPYIQIDAAARPGNSGGMVFDPVSDEVVGVVTQNVAGDPTAGYMIPIDIFKDELARFKELRAAGKETVPQFPATLFPDDSSDDLQMFGNFGIPR